MFPFTDDVRRIIYTTNAIEALSSKLRRAVRTRGHYPNDDAAMKASLRFRLGRLAIVAPSLGIMPI